MKKLRIFLPLIAAVLLVGLISCSYIVHQTESVLIVRLGEAVRTVTEPGLHFKLPWEDPVSFHNWLMDYNSDPREILTKDKKNLVVDNYAKWRIVDPLLFYQKVGNVEKAVRRLDDLIYSEIRQSLGNYTFEEIVKGQRAKIMEAVTKRSNDQTLTFGVAVEDVRIRGADLPKQNESAVFQRMQMERVRDAKLYRSEGAEQARKIQAEADKQRQILLAEASRDAQEVRGKADAEALRIYAAAYGKDPEFFRFFRSLEAYRKSLKQGLTLVVTPEMEMLQYLKNSTVPLPREVQETSAPAPTPVVPVPDIHPK